MAIVDYDDLESALMWVSDGGLGGNQAYVALDTGKIYWTSEYNDVEEEVDRPDDLEISDRYVMLPHKNELDLDRDLVQRFATELLPKYSDEIDSIFRRKALTHASKIFLIPKANSTTGTVSKQQSRKRYCAHGVLITVSKCLMRAVCAP